MAQPNLSDNNHCKTKSPNLFDQLINSAFSPGKFIAPEIDSKRHIFRHPALRSIVLPDRRSNLILIQAQAGQGKSTLAAQFLQHIQTKFAWVRIDWQDRESAVLSTAIFAALLKDFKTLEHSNIYKAILNNEIDSEEPDRFARILLTDIAHAIKEDYYLVLDDLHLLQNSEKSIRFLRVLGDHLPSGFHLMLLSRHTIKGFTEHSLCIDNEALALSRGETADLFAKIYQMPLPAEDVNQLHLTTEGWIKGVIMAGRVLADNPGSDISKLSDLLNNYREKNRLRIYFQNELLAPLTLRQRCTLLYLSLLDDLPQGLLKTLPDRDNISVFLKYLVECNFFIRYVEGVADTYYFHHLFKEFLYTTAVQKISFQQQRIIFAKAGHWHLHANHTEKALRYYLKAKAYSMAEKILRDAALNLAETNRVGSLVEIIISIPYQAVHPYPWLSLSIAYIHLRHNPFESRIFLEQAVHMFKLKTDVQGELLATAALIAFHASVDCRFMDGLALLPRAEELYSLLCDKIPVSARAQSAYALSFGLCHYLGQTRKASECITPVLQLAQENRLDNAMAGAAAARGIIDIMEGVWPVFRQHIESTLLLLFSPHVGRVNKFLLLCQQLTLLGFEGDFEIFSYYRKLIDQFIEQSLLTSTLSGHNVLIAEINTALAKGRMNTAIKLIHSGSDTEEIGQSAHLQSIYLGYKAFLFALIKDEDAALAAAEKSAELRAEIGGPYHLMVNQMILGGAYAILNITPQAEAFLSAAISASERLEETFIRIGAYAHRAMLRLKNNRTRAALSDIRICLEIMKNHAYVHFHTWHPMLMETVLTAAVAHDIERDYALKLANERLLISITPEGEHFPILEIITLGDVALKINDETKVRFDDFTAMQRELLALLASAPEMSLSIEIIQVIFWPDSPPEKIRSKFDNMLARLRKLLSNSLAPYSAGFYLSTGKGFLRLTNCRIDSVCFHREVQNGLDHLSSNHFWQAGNAFLRANRLYNGEFMPEVKLNDQAIHFREELQRYYLESVRHWVQILSASERVSEAIILCRKALECDPTHKPLVKSLYHLLTQNNESAEAAEAINNFRKTLAGDGFSDAEIESIMEDFWC